MTETNPKVDTYLIEGCGRCPLVGTPQCKVHSWEEELVELRRIILESGLTEELKWGMPTYTWDGSNVLILAAFKEYSSVGFFKGVLLKDPAGILASPGANSQAVRQIRVTSLEQVEELEPVIRAYLQEAIEIEKAGLKVEFRKNPEPVPDELQQKFDEDPAFEAAFLALTPGRQRGYILYFSSAKQSATRVSRIEKYLPQIFEGKGMQDR
ncbi:MAG: YdeI/OmpD-associated family protein [Anaerolineales bacterium]